MTISHTVGRAYTHCHGFYLKSEMFSVGSCFEHLFSGCGTVSKSVGCQEGRVQLTEVAPQELGAEVCTWF